MSGSVKTGLSEQQKIGQKEPGNYDKTSNRNRTEEKSASGDGRPGSFKIKR